MKREYRVGAMLAQRSALPMVPESPLKSLTGSLASTPYCETGASGERAQ